MTGKYAGPFGAAEFCGTQRTLGPAFFKGETPMIAGQNTVRLAHRVTWIGIFSNLLLTIFKGAAGLIASSVSMVSDALHSASDLFSDFFDTDWNSHFFQRSRPGTSIWS